MRPACPENNTDCPSVDDIVSGLFPGRSTGLTTAGKYFEIKADETYELLPDYSYFDAGVQFPNNPIIDQPLMSGNPDITSNQISNSIENLNIDTNTQTSLSGMNMGLGPESDQILIDQQKVRLHLHRVLILDLMTVLNLFNNDHKYKQYHHFQIFHLYYDTEYENYIF